MSQFKGIPGGVNNVLHCCLWPHVQCQHARLHDAPTKKSIFSLTRWKEPVLCMQSRSLCHMIIMISRWWFMLGEYYRRWIMMICYNVLLMSVFVARWLHCDAEGVDGAGSFASTAAVTFRKSAVYWQMTDTWAVVLSSLLLLKVSLKFEAFEQLIARLLQIWIKFTPPRNDEIFGSELN